MNDRQYPDGIDSVWLASDRNGHLGAFVTAGVGPIPILALNFDDPAVEDIEQLVIDLPKKSAARVLVSVPRPDDFIDLTERGVFVYDWSDIHRTTRDVIKAYEPVAAPVNPITIDTLPASLAQAAKNLKFVDVAFVSGQPLDVRTLTRCCEGK